MDFIQTLLAYADQGLAALGCKWNNFVNFFRFRNNLNKYQSIFTKLGICFDIVEIWFGIPQRQISSIFDRVICPPHDSGGV